MQEPAARQEAAADRYIEKLERSVRGINALVFKDRQRFVEELKLWLCELCDRNLKIRNGSTPEISVHRLRHHVYWLDFGVNVGSEFNYYHLCILIKEFDYTAVVIPLTSVKDYGERCKTDRFCLNLGVIAKLPEPNNQVESYALVNQIKTVSKTRLKTVLDTRGNFRDIKLTPEQIASVQEGMRLLI